MVKTYEWTGEREDEESHFDVCTLSVGLCNAIVVLRCGWGIMPKIESAVTDLPQPDSPTTPSVSFSISEKLTPSTPFTIPSGTRKLNASSSEPQVTRTTIGSDIKIRDCWNIGILGEFKTFIKICYSSLHLCWGAFALKSSILLHSSTIPLFHPFFHELISGSLNISSRFSSTRPSFVQPLFW